jgi:hypothetical protein
MGALHLRLLHDLFLGLFWAVNAASAIWLITTQAEAPIVIFPQLSPMIALAVNLTMGLVVAVARRSWANGHPHPPVGGGSDSQVGEP